MYPGYIHAIGANAEPAHPDFPGYDTGTLIFQSGNLAGQSGGGGAVVTHIFPDRLSRRNFLVGVYMALSGVDWLSGDVSGTTDMANWEPASIGSFTAVSGVAFQTFSFINRPPALGLRFTLAYIAGMYSKDDDIRVWLLASGM